IVLLVVVVLVADRAVVTSARLEFASAIAGHLKGGPAKVAIISSGMVGSVTGSTVANVYTTGPVTIPMMKRIWAPAPSITAAYANVPYAKVALASLVPALIYYAGLYWYIHLEALKHGLEGFARHENPRR